MDKNTGCTAADDGTDTCGDEIPPGSPVDLCRNHLIKAYLFVQQELASVGQQTVPVSDRPLLTRDDGRACVYYVRFGDRVKIGTSTGLRNRLSGVPHDTLLAVEPGSYDVERGRHGQFAQYRIKGEWFQAHDEILRHAAYLREQHSALLAEVWQ